jgi:hypothetical protein
MKIHGPPIRYWCMRYESFHSISKKRAQANCNFMNISKTLAEHLETKFCFNMLEGFVNKTDTIIQGPCETIGYYDVINRYLLNIDSSILTRDVEITTASWLKIGGWNFIKD